MRVYDWIVIIGFVILFGRCVITKNRYNTLQEDYELMKANKENVIDSLNKENELGKHTICVLEDSLDLIDSKISDNVIVIETIKKEEFVVSPSLSESANLLKKNLACTDL